jgi:predicted glycogen debranching enzyme
MSTNIAPPPEAEWLEADGLGGFASGTVSGVRTRRYHGVLVPAITPPAGRAVLVNGFEAWVDQSGAIAPISSQRYSPAVIHPDGATRLISFRIDPWPVWTFQLQNDLQIEQELFAVHGSPIVVLAWKILANPSPSVKLLIRPLISGRDFHSTHHENGSFQFDATERSGEVIFKPYPGLPSIHIRSDAHYTPKPCWYRNFLYLEEQRRGLDCIEDLASPGIFEWELSKQHAVWILSTQDHPNDSGNTQELYLSLRNIEKSRRETFPSAVHLAGDAYIVRRGAGKTIIAGYPWFGDWGRDTFIALRGLCLSTGRLEQARDILVQWSDAVSEGMLPNRFPDRGENPEFNSVDASLWYVIAVHDYLSARKKHASNAAIVEAEKLSSAVDAILTGYAHGTRFNIHADKDGLLACGQPGMQLTWMDAKVGDWVVTPRIGKPVEVQALWLNALWIGNRFSGKWVELLEKGKESFTTRFWNGSCLFDVVDCDHRSDVNDASLRPNQIFAVGGLPLQLLEGERARKVVKIVETNLLTPIGLRSLGPKEREYMARYEGDVVRRDGSYHQGTVWPWLMGPFVEAWIRIRGNTAEAKIEARHRFLASFSDHLNDAGLGHISEIADAEPPYTPRGCPFQAWSLGEYLRLSEIVLGELPASLSGQRPRERFGS